MFWNRHVVEILIDSQHGFRRSRSCETQLVLFVDELVRSLQKFTNRLECYNSMILLYYTIIYTMSFTVFATLWHVIIWFCFTTTGNYQIREFDWLKSIMKAV